MNFEVRINKDKFLLEILIIGRRFFKYKKYQKIKGLYTLIDTKKIELSLGSKICLKFHKTISFKEIV